MEINHLRCLHLNNPLGIDVIPYFSWEILSDERNVMQSAYRIVVKEKNGQVIWDTSRIQSEQSTYIEYSGLAFKSSTRYEWTATVWDNYDNVASASAWFETALLNKSDWRSRWISSPFKHKKRKLKFGKQPPAVAFRKNFKVKSEIETARLFATSYGIYRACLNGKRLDDREFAPEFTVYENYLSYQTYDVTEFLQVGHNAIGFYVGDGWYFCPETVQPNKTVESVSVLFQILLTYKDGSEEFICSDESVKVSENGPVIFSDLFCGEKYDARKEFLGWTTFEFDDSAWSTGIISDYGKDNLVAQFGQPVRPLFMMPAVAVIKSLKKETIIDFGQVIAGRLNVNIKEKAGTVITFEHTEVLDKDNNYFRNTGGEKHQKDVYICKGIDDIYEPIFTYHGFRYVKITGISNLDISNFKAIVLTSEKEELGSFECSNPLINRLVENSRWSQRANLLSIPTDCPQREKAGWTGDIQIYAKTALLNEDVTPFLTRWLKNLTHNQREDGQVPFVVPNTVTISKMEKLLNMLLGFKGDVCSAGWGDAAVIVPYSMYEVTGNIHILKEQYDSMKQWVDFVISRSKSSKPKGSKLPNEIEKYLWDSGFHFGEWFIPSMSKTGYNFMSVIKGIKKSRIYTAPIYAYISVNLMSEIAKILEKKTDYEYYRDVSQKIRNAIVKGVIRPDGSMPVELMGAYVLPLQYQLVPDNIREMFGRKLVKMIEDNEDVLDTGFLGTPFIMDALCSVGRIDIAYKLLYQEKCPSWLYEVKMGATTIWESWFGYNKDGNPLAISFNHYAFGCVSDWIYRNINGIDKMTPGFKHILIKPQPDGSLTYAKRTYCSEYGEIKTFWKKENGLFILEVNIPCNTVASIFMPNGKEYQVGSGKYICSCNLL